MRVKRLWVGMVTGGGKWDGTWDPIVLVINQGGYDVLHRTLPQLWSGQDQEAGRSDAYDLGEVSHLGIDTDKLTPSAVYFGIRGTNMWTPVLLALWAEGEQPGEARLLAYVEPKTDKPHRPLSGDLDEGSFLQPVPLMEDGGDGMPIRSVLVAFRTAPVTFSATESPIGFRITKANRPVVDAAWTRSSRGGDLGNIGDGDVFNPPSLADFTKLDLGLGGSKIELLCPGNDPWGPDRVFAFGLNHKTRPSKAVTLVYEDTTFGGPFNGSKTVPVFNG